MVGNLESRRRSPGSVTGRQTFSTIRICCVNAKNSNIHRPGAKREPSSLDFRVETFSCPILLLAG